MRRTLNKQIRPELGDSRLESREVLSTVTFPRAVALPRPAAPPVVLTTSTPPNTSVTNNGNTVFKTGPITDWKVVRGPVLAAPKLAAATNPVFVPGAPPNTSVTNNGNTVFKTGPITDWKVVR